MAYELSYPWRKNPRILEIQFVNELTHDEFIAALEAVAQFMDQAILPLHTVLNFASVTVLPQQALDIISSSRFVGHERRGYCVFVNTNEFINFIAVILRNKIGLEIEFARDSDDAWEFFDSMGLC